MQFFREKYMHISEAILKYTIFTFIREMYRLRQTVLISRAKDYRTMQFVFAILIRASKIYAILSFSCYGLIRWFNPADNFLDFPRESSSMNICLNITRFSRLLCKSYDHLKWNTATFTLSTRHIPLNAAGKAKFDRNYAR